MDRRRGVYVDVTVLDQECVRLAGLMAGHGMDRLTLPSTTFPEDEGAALEEVFAGELAESCLRVAEAGSDEECTYGRPGAGQRPAPGRRGVRSGATWSRTASLRRPWLRPRPARASPTARPRTAPCIGCRPGNVAHVPQPPAPGGLCGRGLLDGG